MLRRRLYINGKFTAQSVTGVQRVAIELVKGIDRQLSRQPLELFDEVVLICPPQGQAPELRHIEVRRYGTGRPALQLWEQVVLPRASRDGMLLNLSGSAPWLAARRSVCMLHDAAVFDEGQAYTPVFRAWYRALFRHLAAHAAALLTVSDFSRQRLCAALGIAADRIGVIHHGADHFDAFAAEPGALRAYGLQPEQYLLVVGTQKQTKNIDAVLRAWGLAEHRQDQFLVWVGGANPRVFDVQGERAAGGSAQQGHNLLKVGVVTDSRLKALYQGAAGLVFASRYEGFGLPAVEAMACGCPVAAAAAAALPEVCGDAATYFDAQDIEGLRDAMQAMLSDPALRSRLRERGRARAEALRWDRSVQGLMAHLCRSLPILPAVT